MVLSRVFSPLTREMLFKKIILSSIDYFMKNIPKEQGNIKIVLIMALFDLLMVHDAALSRTQGGSESVRISSYQPELVLS
jgi:hypothetical protein